MGRTILDLLRAKLQAKEAVILDDASSIPAVGL